MKKVYGSKALILPALILLLVAVVPTLHAQTFYSVPGLSFTKTFAGANPLQQVLTAASNGANFNSDAVASTNSGGSWLVLSPASGIYATPAHDGHRIVRELNTMGEQGPPAHQDSDGSPGPGQRHQHGMTLPGSERQLGDDPHMLGDLAGEPLEQGVEQGHVIGAWRILDWQHLGVVAPALDGPLPFAQAELKRVPGQIGEQEGHLVRVVATAQHGAAPSCWPWRP